MEPRRGTRELGARVPSGIAPNPSDPDGVRDRANTEGAGAPEEQPARPDRAGVILFPKPAGPTSHDIVARVRGGLRAELRRDPAYPNSSHRPKVGHAGTLDPFATGVLLVLVGRATRVQRFLMALPKTYRAVARLGWRSDTGDSDGQLVATGRVPRSVAIPVGDLEQRPPAFSAARVGGERLHRRARRGDPVEGAPRRVTVHRAETLWQEGDRACIEVEVSSGTYVRQLIAALGDAYCEELERVAIGPFRLADADEERLVPLEEALRFLPERELGDDEARRVAHGVAVEADGGWGMADGGPGAREAAASTAGGASAPAPSAAAGVAAATGPSGATEAVRLTHVGRLLAIGEPRGGLLKPTVVLSP